MSAAANAPVLGGEVNTSFKFGKPEDYHASAEAARVEQEAMCGYALVVKTLRQTHYQDDKGNDVYEVYATFGPPAPDTIVRPVMSDGTKV